MDRLRIVGALSGRVVSPSLPHRGRMLIGRHR